jgi:hypothetical protein
MSSAQDRTGLSAAWGVLVEYQMFRFKRIQFKSSRGYVRELSVHGRCVGRR